MGAASTVLVAEGMDVVAQFAQGRCSSATGQAGTYAKDLVFTFIRGIDLFRFETVTIPGSFYWSSRTFAIEYH